MPLLSTRANASARGYGMFGGAAASLTAYESIATVAGSGQTTISFSSIPSTYKHLQIRVFASTNRGSTANLQLRFNSDTAANYVKHELVGDGATAAAYATTGATLISLDRIGGNTTTFGALVIDILDYADTNKFKTVRNLGGIDSNGSGQVNLQSGLWRSTSAISSLSFITVDGANTFITNSQFALYGIKG